MRQVTSLDRFRYAFDNTMSRGAVALIGWLFLASLVVIVLFSCLVLAAHLIPVEVIGGEPSLADVVWSSAMHALDAGTIAGDQGPWTFRLTMFGMTLVGLFLVSILIGIITSGIEARLEELRKGRSLVVEANHTVILGWSPQVFTIVAELAVANANQKRPVIAILGDKDKVDMEDELRDKVGDTGNTRVVCRRGRPLDLTDLEIVNPHRARAIIIPTPDLADPDTEVIKTILALTNNPNRRATPYHIVASLRDAENDGVAKLVGRKEVEVVLADDFIARLTVQTSLQAGLSVIYSELFDFGGDEIYFAPAPTLAGKSFGEALLAYERATLLGFRFADGRIQLNPPMHTTIAAGDQVIAIAADDDKVQVSGRNAIPIDFAALRQPNDAVVVQPIHTLILGWNRRAPLMIAELDHYVPPASQTMVVAAMPEADLRAACTAIYLKNSALTFQEGETTRRTILDELQIDRFDHVLVLSDSDRLDAQAADAHTLITLLHLRDISEKLNHKFSITSEMLDVQNRNLATVTQADDFIVSERLVSLVLAQLAENKDLALVFADLLDADGAEIYLKPVSAYVEVGKPLNFYTLVEAARQRGEVAIGYRLLRHAHDPAQTYGVRLNPVKSDMVTYCQEDRLVVLADGA
ncbi:MAG: potassium transporter TrkA [Caldilinea sp. CFX5]|nr:potassium transporter TrkA [Caldilinea sp. CFX5]